jgi:hypothetical protein
MATITTLANPLSAGTTIVQSSNVKIPYMIWKEIDFAAAATAKGSALAASDVIEAVRVPANHIVLGGFAKKTSAMTGTTTDLTLSIGITGGVTNNIVNAWDYDAAAVGTFGTLGTQVPVQVTASDTVDILIATQTGTLTGGKILVGILAIDCDVEPRANIAQPKS